MAKRFGGFNSVALIETEEVETPQNDDDFVYVNAPQDDSGNDNEDEESD